MVTIAPSRKGIREINFVKADSWYWIHDEYSSDSMKNNLLEILETMRGRPEDRDLYVGGKVTSDVAYELSMHYGFRDVTRNRLDALPPGTHFILTHYPNTGASHLFFKGHYELELPKANSVKFPRR